MTAVSVCNKPLSCFPLTMMPGKYFTVKSNCKTPSVGTFLSSFIFLSPLVIIDRTPQKIDKTDPPKWGGFSIRFSDSTLSHKTTGPSSITHADNLTDSTRAVHGSWSPSTPLLVGLTHCELQVEQSPIESVHTPQAAWLMDEHMIWSSWLGAFYSLLLLVSSCSSCS